MARQARGLVCLALTPQRCEELELPLMVEGDDSLSPLRCLLRQLRALIPVYRQRIGRERFRWRSMHSVSHPIWFSPTHLPDCGSGWGVLTRTAPAEVAVDLTTLAGLTPAAVFTEVLDGEGAVASGDYWPSSPIGMMWWLAGCQIW